MNVTIFCIMILCFTCFIFYKENSKVKIMKDFDLYSKILNNNMSESYEIIYKEKILLYSVEGRNLSDEEVPKIRNEFVKLVIKLNGKSIQKKLKIIYGDDHTLFLKISNFFDLMLDNDEIRKINVENTTQNDYSGVM